MNKFALILAAVALTPATATFATEAVETANVATPVVGKMLYSTGGKKLAPVYKLDASGAPQILLEGRMITVPSSTLSAVDGRVETSLTKKVLMTSN
ncbi:hypothetical protein FSB78_04365 [Sphingomonas ginsenosidivorax]|uniref:Uncharacterized protein n=1 Tax=Sphingomonas ginsenosidivorax TaxID=862135 RepID=A0A5C6UC33_9SPHN|nr:hypothetical protein [Sphingomonas ginsenosidivorax]TXC70262.1 hypothetical protein FSB78_04365 [Sphingomonas ginsenosidivorax]